MRIMANNLRKHLRSEVTTLASCCGVTLRSGKWLGFSDYESDLVINGKLYRASNAPTLTAIEITSGMAVDNLEIEAALDSEFISKEDLLAGVYDYAYIEILLVNYLAQEDGAIVLKAGYIGEVRLDNERFVAEIRGLSQKLSASLGEQYSPLCRTNLGSKECKVDLESRKQRGRVEKPISNARFIVDNIKEQKWQYRNGLLEFTNGYNQNLIYQIKEFNQGEITLLFAATKSIKSGDRFVISPGCDKKFTTCCGIYDNALNFRGEPDIPGLDEILKTAGTFERSA